MYEGKPMVMVVGGTDTGRAPIAAGLLRHAFGNEVIVVSAGVVAHAGESAATEAELALEQFGIDISNHRAQAIRASNHRDAEILLAVDHGTQIVLFSEFPNDPRIECLSKLAAAPDVLDPHRMPLGVWISITRQLSDQVKAAMPALRQHLGLPTAPAAPTLTRLPAAPLHQPMTVSNGASKRWDRDEDMARLFGLINEHASTEAPHQVSSHGHEPTLTAAATDANETVVAEASTSPATDEASRLEAAPPEQAVDAAPPAGDRAALTERMYHLIEVAEDAPEIIDWSRLRHALVTRLRIVAQQAEDAQDFVPAAALMIEGKLMQQSVLPQPDALFLLRRAVSRLGTTVDPINLGLIGTDLGQW